MRVAGVRRVVGGGCVLRMVSDSHGRGWGVRLRGSEVGKSLLIEDLMKSGDPFMSMIDRAGVVANRAETSDFLLVVGGTNCVMEDSNDRLGPRLDALAKGIAGRVIWVETPYRYDKPNENIFVKKQSEVLKEKCKKHKWAFLGLNSLLDRSCYTAHGIHLNWRGKDVLCSLITNYIACTDSVLFDKIVAASTEREPSIEKNLKTAFESNEQVSSAFNAA
ncbi:hypothetical protein J6590_069928 [Homalodisca vitripennis]|nr:hypothetical protein J6590_069928 [Homalodisca vitripennis]